MEQPRLLIGDDWSQDHHTICFMNPHTGGVIATFDVDQSATGFARICSERQKLGFHAQDCHVGIETGYNLIVDYYLDHHYPVFVIAPSVTKSSQNRFTNSGAYTDQSAALLLADILRTGRERFAPWRPHSPLIEQMLVKVRLARDLTQEITRWTNRLQAVLLRANPVPLGLFNSLTAQISLHFLIRYPTYQAATELTLDELKSFCRAHGYPHPRRVFDLYAHLQRQVPKPSLSISLAYADQIQFMAQTLLPIVRHRRQILRQLEILFEQHPDFPIFSSLPRAGELLAPGLLVKFGDDRERFPTPASVQALAGTCPVTQQSGKRKTVRFRRACDKEFRWLITQFAFLTLRESAWAIAYYNQLTQRGIRGSHAIRCLANRWLAIIWTVWQRHQAYDESYHMRQRYQRHQPRH
jgi:transposase